MYWAQLSWWLTILIPTVAIWFIMAPPRFVLDYLSHRSAVHFRFPSQREGVTVYITIDDAPSPHTHLIIKALDECCARATFFAIGDQVRQYPDVVRSIISHGNTVGNHDWKDRLTANPLRSFSEIVEGMKLTDREIVAVVTPSISSAVAPSKKRWFRPEKRWFRPGCGLYRNDVLLAAKQLDYSTVLGDTYGHDVVFEWCPQIVITWLAAFYSWRVVPGSIVILHDGSMARATNSAKIIKYMFDAHPNLRFEHLPAA